MAWLTINTASLTFKCRQSTAVVLVIYLIRLATFSFNTGSSKQFPQQLLLMTTILKITTNAFFPSLKLQISVMSLGGLLVNVFDW